MHRCVGPASRGDYRLRASVAPTGASNYPDFMTPSGDTEARREPRFFACGLLPRHIADLTCGRNDGTDDRVSGPSREPAEKCPRLVLGILTLVANKRAIPPRPDATGLPGGVSRSSLVTSPTPASNVTIHRASRWHSAPGAAVLSSSHR